MHDDYFVLLRQIKSYHVKVLRFQMGR